MNSIESAIANLETALNALKRAYEAQKTAEQIQNQDLDFETVNGQFDIRL